MSYNELPTWFQINSSIPAQRTSLRVKVRYNSRLYPFLSINDVEVKWEKDARAAEEETFEARNFGNL